MHGRRSTCRFAPNSHPPHILPSCQGKPIVQEVLLPPRHFRYQGIDRASRRTRDQPPGPVTSIAGRRPRCRARGSPPTADRRGFDYDMRCGQIDLGGGSSDPPSPPLSQYCFFLSAAATAPPNDRRPVFTTWQPGRRPIVRTHLPDDTSIPRQAQGRRHNTRVAAPTCLD